LTVLAATDIAIANTQVSGLGTMSTQAASSVAITGGTINGTTIGGSTAAAVTGTTITANTQFTGAGTGLTGTATSLSIGGNAATATSATTATNLAGGATGSVPYQTGTGATSFLALGTTNYVLTAGVAGPQYVAQSTLSVGSATTATNVTGVVATANGGTGLTSFTSGGVVYASSSSALATGSALTFDGTNLGIGTSSPAFKLDVRSGSTPTTAFLDTTAATAYSAGSFFSGANLTIRTNANATGNGAGIRFSSNNNGGLEGMFGWVQNSSTYGDFVWQGYNGSYGERMRLDSAGNLGLGVTAPTQNLETIGTIRIKSANADANGLNLNSDAGGVGYINAGYASVGAIALQTAGVTKFYVGPSGQFGIGGATYGSNGQVLTSSGSGSAPTWATPASGITIADDTTTNATRYLLFTSATSGTVTTQNVSSTKLKYNPSTGAFTANQLIIAP
jgi:hypothetical protein